MCSELRRRLGLLALVAGLGFAVPGGALAAKPTAANPVPRGFVGMNADGPLFNAHVDLPGELKKMVQSGVQHLRVEFVWARAQPYATCQDVPADQRDRFTGCPGGVPTDFTSTDQVVTEAAKRHLPLLPVVMASPSWDRTSKDGQIQPAHDEPYGAYLTALVKRYGSHGTFWSSHRSLPRDAITEWQIWNEPDLSFDWATQPFAHSYVALLKLAHKAIKQADPRAAVVLAALTNYGWRDLDSIYKVHGSRGLFDAVAADVYTQHPSGVITILNYYRKVMAKRGDGHKPLIATELGWPSDRGTGANNPPFSTTEQGQASKLSRLLPLLAAKRHQLRLKDFFYYTWITTDTGGSRTWYFYSGLLEFDRTTHHISPKPAYWAFRRTVRRLEG